MNEAYAITSLATIVFNSEAKVRVDPSQRCLLATESRKLSRRKAARDGGTHVLFRIDEVGLLDRLPKVKIPLTRHEPEQFQPGETTDRLFVRERAGRQYLSLRSKH